VVLSENTSRIGNPDMLLTENKDPESESVILNNSPCEPCIDTTVEPDL
jgi:hypothetical protein